MRIPLLLVIFTAAFNALVHFGNANYFRGDPKLDFDSPFYVQLHLWLKGEWDTLPPQPFRMRPLIPLLSTFLSNYIGVNNSFGLINTILWMVTVTLYFLAVKKLYDLKTATVSSVIFSFSVPVMVYGAAISTDMLGYLAIAASIYYLSASPNPDDFKLGKLVILSVLLYFTVIGREVSVLAIGYIFVYRLLNGWGLKATLKEISCPTILSLAGVATVSLLIPDPGYTAYFYPALQKAFDLSKITQAIFQIIATYHVGWLPILITSRHMLEKRDDKLFLTSIIVGGGFILLDHFIGIVSSRFVFLTFPGFLVAILKGTDNLSYSIGKLLKLKTTQYRIIGWILILLYIIIGFVATAEKNIAFPTTTDKSIAKLFPDGYDKNLWGS
jgi:hypothetical protein